MLYQKYININKKQSLQYKVASHIQLQIRFLSDYLDGKIEATIYKELSELHEKS